MRTISTLSTARTSAMTTLRHMNPTTALSIRQLGQALSLSLSFLLFNAGAFMHHEARAQIVADKRALGGHQATVITGANGVPVVNITTPNADGISRNVYIQFDVDGRGVVMNNGRVMSPTELAGWVQANPWLMRGTARIILNEVNSSNPSQIGGYIEIAGQKADIIIANPSGINIGGAGFINAGKVTLTTGVATVEAGGNIRLAVNQGAITLTGEGLDARQVGYTEILARAVNVNAGIWAQELSVQGGIQTTSAFTGQGNATNVANVNGQPGTGDTTTANLRPQFAIDVGALGGMYAGKITLVGTERGVGVRNAGEIGASAGQIKVTADGQIVNTGLIVTSVPAPSPTANALPQNNTAADIQIQGASIANSGSISSQNNLTLSAVGSAGVSNADGTSSVSAIAPSISNSGLMTAQRELTLRTQSQSTPADAGSISNTGGTINAKRLDIETGSLANSNAIKTDGSVQIGKIQQTGAQDLSVQAHTLSQSNGAILGALPQTSSPSTPTDPTSPTTPVAPTTPASTGTGGGNVGVVPTDSTAANPSNTTPAEVLAAGRINATSISNAGGQITVSGATDVQTTQALSNQSGAQINVRQLNATGTSLSNTGASQINAASVLSQTATFNNSGGNIVSTSGITVVATGTAANAVNNQGGVLSANQAIRLSASAGGINNQSGLIASSDAVIVTAQSVNNDNTFNTAAPTTSTDAAGAAVSTPAAQTLGIQANAIAINVHSISSQTGLMSATTTLELNAANTPAGVGSTPATINLSQGQHSAGGNTTVTSAGDINNQGGTVSSNAAINLTAQGGALNNAQGQISAGTTASLTAQGNINNQGGTIGAAQTLNLTSTQGNINNAQGRLSATGDVSLNTSTDANPNPQGSVDNTSGLIASSAAVNIATSALINQNTRTAQGNLGIQGNSISIAPTALQTLDNRSGLIVSNTDLSITSAQSINNQGGALITGGALTLNAASIDNTINAATQQSGAVQAAQAVTLTTSGDVNNTGGQISAGQTLAITSTQGSINNQSGSITATGNAALTANQGGINNQAGLIASNQTVNLTAQTVNNDNTVNTANTLGVQANAISVDAQTISSQSGAMTATTSLGLTASGGTANAINLSQGQHSAGGDLTLISAGGINNQGGALSSNGAITLNAQGTITNTQGQISATGNIALTANQGAINNQGGLIASNQTVTLTAQTVSNDNTLNTAAPTTSINAQGQTITTPAPQTLGIQANNIAIDSANVSNQTGLIVAANTLDIAASLTVNNTAGRLEAGHTLTVHDSVIAQANSLTHNNTAKTLALINTGGTLTSGVQTTVNVKSVTTDGTLESAGNLDALITSDFNRTDATVFRANGTASLTTNQDIHNTGTWRNAGGLTLNAASITNAQGGEISSGGTTTLNTTQNPNGTITNRGLIDGVDTVIKTTTLDNIGTGRIYGDNIAIQAATVNNVEETTVVGGVNVTKGAVIAARIDLDIGAQTINNTGKDALIYAGNDITIGGTLNANNWATGSATTVNNHGATIESGRDMVITANTVNNTNANFVTTLAQVIAPSSQTLISPSGSQQRYNSSLFRWEAWSRAGQYRWNISPTAGTTVVLGSTPVPRVGEQTCTGEEPNEICTAVAGAAYLNNDPAWTYFNLPHPAPEPTAPTAPTAPATPTLTQPTAPAASGAQSCQTGLSYNAAQCTTYNNAQTQYTSDLVAYNAQQTQYNTQLTAYNTAQTQYTTDLATYTAAHAAWVTQTESRRDALDTSIETYNNQFAGAAIRAWTQFNITRTEYETQVVSTTPGQIIAGGDLILRGTLNNFDSRVMGGGTIDKTQGAVNNIATQGQHVVHDEGTVQSTWSRWRGGFKRYHQRDWSPAEAYTPADVITSVNLGAAVEQQNTATSTTTAGAGTRNTADATGTGQGAAHTATAPTNTAQTVTGRTTTSATPPPTITLTRTTGGGQIRTSAPSLRLPGNSLYLINPTGTSALIETDPRFTNQRNFLNSDYLLKLMGADPATTTRRLGDGFYEQKLIREQIANLTGMRFLGDYQSDEAQYTALMQNAATYAKTYTGAHTLRPGIALSPEQVAALTSDIVWLVEQEVTLQEGPNKGTKVKALVPQVYARIQPQDLSPTGQLLAGVDTTTGGGASITGKNVVMNLGADSLNNQGAAIAGKQVVSINAGTLNNLSGARITGQAVGLQSSNDVNIIGATVEAKNALIINAGGNVNVQTTTQSSASANGKFSQTGMDRVAGLYVGSGAKDAKGKPLTPEGALLSITAGTLGTTGTGTGKGNINLTAANLVNTAQGSTTVLDAQGDINLATITTAKSEDITWDARNYRRESSTTEVGTNLQSVGNIQIKAGNNVNARAANVGSSEGILSVAAGKDINLTAGRATSTFDSATHTQSSGFLSKKSSTTVDSIKTDNAVGSNFEGAIVSLDAGNNVTIKGSSVVSDQLTAIKAGNDVNILADTNTRDESHFNQTKKSGFTAMQGGGINVGYSANKTATTATSGQTTAAGSLVGSTGAGGTAGNIIIQAGGTYRQTGSDVMTPAGDIDISAKRVEITEARETTHNQTRTDTKTAGISVGVSNAVLGAAQGINSMAQAAKQTSSGRAQALAGAAAGLTAYNTATDIVKNPGSATQVSVAVTASISKSTSQSQSQTDTARGSNVSAGGNVNIKATGDGENSDVVIQGSKVSAGKNVTLKADDDLLLQASKDSTSERSSNKSSGASVGVGISGAGAGGVTVGASRGKGAGNGESTTYNNTSIQAGGTATLDSGNDTTLKGANVNAAQVIANIGIGTIANPLTGGNLTIESLQDSATYNSKQQNASGSITLGPAPGGSVSLSQSKVNSTYTSVGTQSGIATGVKDKDGNMVDGGFQINVQGNTTLTGGKVTSTDAAVQNNANTFNTQGTLTTTDLQNQAQYSAKSVSLTVGTSGGGGVGSASGNAASTTQSGITGITNAGTNNGAAGNAALRTGDAETAIKPIFDKDKVTKDVQAQTQITQQFGMQASKTVGDEMGKKEADLKTQAAKETDPTKKAALTEEAAKYAEGGTYRILAHTVIGGLTGGNLQGALGAGAAASSAPALDQLQAGITQSLVDSGMNPQTAQGLAKAFTGAAAAGIGAAAGGGTGNAMAGAATALNSDMNNRQLHPKETDWIKQNAKKYAAQNPGMSEAEAEKQLAQQAFRQVQTGAEGAWNEQAQNFLRQANGMLDPANPQGVSYMFQATDAQKRDSTMYMHYPNQTFYRANGVVQPTQTQINNAAQREQTIDNRVGAATIAAPVVSILGVGVPISAGATGVTAAAINAGMGGVTGAGTDAAGQMYNDGTVKPERVIFAATVGAVSGPLGAQTNAFGNAVIGSAGNALNTQFSNTLYGASESLWGAAGLGFVFGGAGAKVGSWLDDILKTKPSMQGFTPNPTVPALLQAPPKPPSSIPQILNTGASGVIGGSTFVPDMLKSKDKK